MWQKGNEMKNMRVINSVNAGTSNLGGPTFYPVKSFFNTF